MQAPEPKVVKISEELSCQLNEVEWQNRARELAEAHKDVARQEERKKTVTAGLNNDVKIAKAKESKLADIVATREEQREVTVEIRYDYELGTVTKIRTDTDEVIREREMTDNERQAELEFHDANDVIEDIREGERAEEAAAEEAESEETATDEAESEVAEDIEADDSADADEDDDEDLGEGNLPESDDDEVEDADDDDDWDLGEDEDQDEAK